ncbi:hypothetical protein ACS0TY_017265 [Phlomoides rotata]
MMGNVLQPSTIQRTGLAIVQGNLSRRLYLPKLKRPMPGAKMISQALATAREHLTRSLLK